MHLKLKGVALMKLDEKELYSLNVHVLTSKYKQLVQNKWIVWIFTCQMSTTGWTQNPLIKGSSLGIYVHLNIYERKCNM